MGIEEEADRTLFIRNLDTRVSEELLFELFLQAGPLIKTKIPKDPDGKQKTFGFAVYKHEVSVPYAMQLLDGSTLYGKNIHVQFRSGSSHSNSPGNSRNSSPANTPDPHGQRVPEWVTFKTLARAIEPPAVWTAKTIGWGKNTRAPMQFSSPPYTPPPQMQRSSDNLQKQIMMNNIMWQVHMRQLDQLSGSLSKPLQSPGGHGRQHDSAPYRHYSSPSNSRGQRYSREEENSSRQGRDGYHHHHHNDRSGNRHHDSRGGNRQYDERVGNRGYQDNKWRRY